MYAIYLLKTKHWNEYNSSIKDYHMYEITHPPKMMRYNSSCLTFKGHKNDSSVCSL